MYLLYLPIEGKVCERQCDGLRSNPRVQARLSPLRDMPRFVQMKNSHAVIRPDGPQPNDVSVMELYE